jgi:predicted translin family RNA/ssDNA-binding protein
MDIVERLRRINAFLHVTEDEPEYDYKLSYEAADEIERLREAAKDRPKDRPNESADEIERLRKALKQFCDSYQPHLSPERCQHCSEAYWEARAALKEDK